MCEIHEIIQTKKSTLATCWLLHARAAARCRPLVATVWVRRYYYYYYYYYCFPSSFRSSSPWREQHSAYVLSRYWTEDPLTGSTVIVARKYIIIIWCVCVCVPWCILVPFVLYIIMVFSILYISYGFVWRRYT